MRLEVVDRIKEVIHDLWPSAEVYFVLKPQKLQKFFFRQNVGLDIER